MVKYRVKASVPHIKVDGKLLSPGDVFEQPAEFFERNKVYVDLVLPRKTAIDIENEETKTITTDDTSSTEDESNPRVIKSGRKNK